MAINRSKFLRLFWRQRKDLEFARVRSLDGLDYIVPIPIRGPVKAPYSKLESRTQP